MGVARFEDGLAQPEVTVDDGELGVARPPSPVTSPRWVRIPRTPRATGAVKA
jgi:hypothetical protein